MRRAICLTLLFAGLLACAASPFSAAPTPTPTRAATLVIYADAAVANVLRDIGTSFMQANLDLELEWHFAEPQILLTRLEQGAQPNFVMSADSAIHGALMARSHPAVAPTPIASDPLVLIVIDENPAQLERAEDLNRPGLRVAIAGERTALGQATQALIENFRHDAAFGPDFPALFYDSVTVHADDGRGVLNAVVENRAEVGIVYASQANLERNRVRVFGIDEGLNVPAAFAVIPLRTAPDSQRASSFVEYLNSPQAQTLWRDYGFEPQP